MSNTVFILGAGASKTAGAPLMPDFLDVAEELKNSRSVSDELESFNLVFEALGALRDVHAKANLDLDNVESAFAAFEMAKLLGRLGDLEPAKIERLPTAMRQ